MGYRNPVGIKTESDNHTPYLRKTILFVSVVLCIAILLESFSRLYITGTHHSGLLHPERAIYWYYPQIKPILRAEQSNSEIRILILSSSYLNSKYFTETLKTDLSELLRQKVTIVNLSRFGYTSFDETMLYRTLKTVRFDMVVFYEGLNDLRLNNCPPALFKTDYSHFGRYGLINFLIKHQLLIHYLSFPYSVYHLTQILIPEKFLPFHSVSHMPEIRKRGWTKYGGDFKTGQSLKMNLEDICSIATQKKERVLIVGQCIYIDPRYTDSLFELKKLDYKEHTYGLSSYGDINNLRKEIPMNDSIIREVASQYKNISYVNFCTDLPQGKEYFNDPAHYTTKGIGLFAHSLAGSIVNALR